jgi:hypothetical protein
MLNEGTGNSRPILRTNKIKTPQSPLYINLKEKYRFILFYDNEKEDLSSKLWKKKSSKLTNEPK